MVITAVVCVVCSFTAGLLLGVLVTLCNVHYHKKQKRDQTERPPVYESIPHYQHMCLYSGVYFLLINRCVVN